MEPRGITDWGEHYSPRNQLILASVGATQVAGYREWQAVGRQVRRGEHGIQLTAPVVRKDPDTGETKMVNVKTVTVFDVAQTDPIARSAEELEAMIDERNDLGELVRPNAAPLEAARLDARTISEERARGICRACPVDGHEPAYTPTAEGLI